MCFLAKIIYISVTLCTSEDLKFHQGGTQETIVFTTAAMMCKHSVMSKQQGEGLSGVCVGVWDKLHIKP